MKRLILIAVFLTAPAFAQQPQRISDEEINVRIQVLTSQRDENANRVVVVSGQASTEIGKLQAEIAALKKEVEALKAAKKE